MSSRPLSRRALLLLVAGAACVLLVLHSQVSSESSLTSRLSLRSTSTSSFTAHLAALSRADESAAVPLVSALASFALASPSASNATVAICAVPTHEEQYLPEWITWHRLLGVERFFLFDNSPSMSMRRLLRPWIEEGVVVLYEIDYEADIDIGTIYQNHVLKLCEKFVFPHVRWVSHHDVDEFLMVDAPGWVSSVPSPLPSSAPDSPAAPALAWTYPLHARFEMLADATCLPMLRLPYQNYGVQELKHGEMVTERQTVRDKVGPNFHTYGKIFLHTEKGEKKASWMGPHSCKALPDSVVLDAQGKEFVFERGSYPYAGLPLPQEGLYLNHYIQRSLHDCYNKFHVLADTPQDWRSRDGLAGCARNYIPTDLELSTPSLRAALEAQEQGAVLVERPESWSQIMTRDVRAPGSWQGRMTKAVLDEWRRRGGERAEKEGRWYWEYGDEASEANLEWLEGVIRIEDVFKEIKGF
ncbi:hypothetical protein JCM8097_000181 [Rhodosporidiobolus ruineniae]